MRLLVPAAIAMAAGIALGEEARVPLSCAGLAAAVAIAAVRVAWRGGRAARATAGCLVGAALGLLRIALVMRPPGPESVAAHTGAPPALVVGNVAGLPRRLSEGASLHIAVDRVNGRVARGRLRLRVRSGVPTCLPGDRVAIIARLHAPRGYVNFGVPDRTLAARLRGLRAVATVMDARAVRILARGPPGLLRAVARKRAEISARLDQKGVGDARALVGALTLGERALVSEETQEAFRRSGTTHLLTVSGLHLAAIALLAYAGSRRIMARFPIVPLLVRVRAVAALLTLPACVLYALLAGAQIPVVRAAIMTALVLCALIVDRASDGATTLAAAALVLLAAEPGALFDPSFQLSFAACAGLLLAPRTTRRGLLGAVIRTATATGTASLATAGLSAVHFGAAPLLGVVTNLVAIPFSTLLLLPAALTAVLIPQSLPLAEVLAEVLIELARVGASIPWASVQVPTPTLLEQGLWALALGLLLRGHWKLALTAALTLALAVGWRQHSSRVRDGARVTVLDVGQGDAVLLEVPGKTLLCDGGGSFGGPSRVGEAAVLPALRARGVRRLDVIVLTHPHPDHLGGLAAVVRELPVGEIWTSGEPCTHPTCLDLLAATEERRVPWRPPRILRAGSATIEPLHPLPRYDPAVSTNDNSVVLRVGTRATTALLSGDLEAEGELLLRAAAGDAVRADLLKVPHHGSRTSSTAEFLDAVRPRVAIVSAGSENSHGFPHPDVLDRYRRRGIEVFRTDLHGAVSVELGRDLRVTIAAP